MGRRHTYAQVCGMMPIMFIAGKQPKSRRKCSFSITAFLEVVHTKFKRGKASKFCGIITEVESFNMVLCSQKPTRHAISKSIYIPIIIFLFQDWNVYPYLKKERPYNLTNSRNMSIKSPGHLLNKHSDCHACCLNMDKYHRLHSQRGRVYFFFQTE